MSHGPTNDETQARPPWPSRLLFGSLAVASLAGGASLFLACRPAPPARPPNVLLVVLDTVRADAVSVEVGGRPVTPNVDRLAREGATFASAFTAAPWTLPSHGSIFTGLYPHRHRAVHEHFVLDQSLTTIAERLAGRGYQTAGFTTNPWLRRDSGMAQGFATYDEVYRRTRDARDKGAAEATAALLAWLERLAPEKPLFAFVNYVEAHLPYRPPPEALDRVAGPEAGGRTSVSLEEAERFIAGEESVTADELRRLYLAEVADLDRQVGALSDALEAAGELERTVLIVTSDHGEHLGEHRLAGHELSVFEPLLRVPLVIRYPAAFPAGTRVERPVCLVDLLPTLLELVGAPPLPGLDGQSLLAASESPVATPRPLLAEYSRPVTLLTRYWGGKYPGLDMSRFDRGLKAVRVGRHKLIVSSRGERSLYDLVADPREEDDLAEKLPDTLAALGEELEGMLAPRRAP